METAAILKDWDRREDIEAMKTSVLDICRFLNKFGMS